MLEDTRRMNADDWAFDYPASSSNPGKSFSANRPRIIESRDSHPQPRNSGSTFNDFIDAENHHPGSMAVEASPLLEEGSVRAPCPHAECRSYSKIMYRLQRLDSEDLSEMCLHLFRVHHTTPFPCGELHCKRKGEEGYFMQADLVKHVRIAHPNAGALQRLRGRVDAELLDRGTELARPPKNMSSVPLNERPVSQARDSDFMSPSKRYDARVTSSSRPFSSSSHDRTPRGTTGMMGASTPTPMTSVSSLKVNRSSAMTVAMREVSESHESLMSEEQADEVIIMSSWTGQVPGEQLNGVPTAKPRTPAFREPLVQGPALSKDVTGRGVLPTPIASTWDSPGHVADGQFKRNESLHLISSDEPEASTEVQPSRHPSSSATRTASGSKQSPNRTSNPQGFLDKRRTISLAEPRNKASSTRKSVSQVFSRNTVDPSYEFSDEEVGIEPITKQLPPKSEAASSTASQPAANALATNTSTKMPPATAQLVTKPSLVAPAAKASTKVQSATVQPIANPSTETPANRRKSLLQRVLESDYDELSLGADDFAFMFSQPRTDSRASSKVQVKEENATDTPQNISSVPARKRKLSMFRAGSDDELCVIGPSPPLHQPLPTVSNHQIKVEVDDATLPLHQPIKTKARARKVSDIYPEASSSSQPKPQARRISKNQPTSRNTPLLDLTPSRSKASNPNGREILDSAAEESSPPEQVSSPNHPRNRTRAQREAAGTSSPLVGLLTPVRRKRWSGDLLEGEEVTVVVKTPGGTLRRCGEDGFECGRSFCFRCGERREGDDD
jgi:hypothetical protein